MVEFGFTVEVLESVQFSTEELEYRPNIADYAPSALRTPAGQSGVTYNISAAHSDRCVSFSEHDKPKTVGVGV